MAQITADIRIDPLRAVLLELGERRRMILWLTRLVRAVWVWCAALLSVLLLDAILPMGPAGRIVCDVLLLLGIPVGLLLTRTREPNPQRGPLGDARRLETHHDLPHNPLVNGLFLSPLVKRHDDALVATLAERTHDRAEDTVQRVDRQVVLDRRALRREFVFAGIVAVIWFATLIAAPGLLGTGIARMVMPFEDTPPFSFTEIELTAEPLEPFIGDDVTLTAIVTGEPAPRVELVFLDDQLQPMQRVPMSLVTDGYLRRLRLVTEPIIVQAEGNGARSKRLHITPKPRPPEEADAEKKADPSKPDERQPRMMAPQQPKDTFDLAKEFPELYAKIQELQQQAQQIGEMMEQLQQHNPKSPAYQQKLDDIEAALEAFRQCAAEGAAMARDAAQRAETTDKQREMLEALAKSLESLGMCKLGSCPNPGIAPGSSGKGAGGGGLMGSPLQNWLNGLQNAQLNDFSFISQMLRDMGFAASPFGDAGPRDAHATSLSGDPDPVVGGEYAEMYDLSQGDGVLPDRAVMQRVPPAYRPLVRRYYERLAEDERSRP